MDFRNSVDWTFPIPIFYGPERINEVSALCKKHEIKRPLVITDKGSADLEIIKNLINQLNSSGLKTDLFSAISPNPIGHEIYEGKAVYNGGQHDGIIAIGGGSGMDGGKAVSLIANNDDDLWKFDYNFDVNHELIDFPPLICIPTTAGTGAETESTAMVTNSDLGMKFCLWHPKQKPLAAILDPSLTIGLPKTLTAWTGVDALVHAVEAYCVDDLHPAADGTALEGLRLIGENLVSAYKNPDNIEARGGMLIGSCLAGIAFLKGLGLVHAISHMVGAEYDTQHGLTNAIILPSVLKFNEDHISHKVNRMHFSQYSKPGTFDEFYSGVCNLLDELSIPNNLGEIGVGSDRFHELAVKARKDSAAFTNPRDASIEEIRNLISETFHKGR